jgi:hypothetical protein
MHRRRVWLPREKILGPTLKVGPWTKFIQAHFGSIETMDFFTVEDMTLFGLVRYHVLFVIDIATLRRTFCPFYKIRVPESHEPLGRGTSSARNFGIHAPLPPRTKLSGPGQRLDFARSGDFHRDRSGDCPAKTWWFAQFLPS